MTVRELIQELEQQDQSATVWFADYHTHIDAYAWLIHVTQVASQVEEHEKRVILS